MTLGRILSLISLCFFPAFLTGQIEYAEVATASGIVFSYSSPSYMGGGAAFFDFDNDGDDDIWIAGGLGQDLLYENDGNGNFSVVGPITGLEITNNVVTTGVITGDLDNDGYRDVLVTPHVGQQPLLFKNNGDGTFVNAAQFAGLGAYEAQTHAAAMGDVNGDGLLDIYMATYIDQITNIYDSAGLVVGFDHHCFQNLLFLNNGDWTFTEIGADYGVNDSGCALATMFTDYDQDADPDILVANDFGAWITPNQLYQNDFPSDTFSNISQPSGMDVGIYGMGIAVGDYDRDSDLDYYITNLGRNVLLENQNEGRFEDKTTQTGTEDTYMLDSLLAVGWGTAFMDIDNDADLDLFVCNGYVPAAGFIANPEENKNRLFLNDGNATGTGYRFTEEALNSGLADEGRGRGFAYSDYDNDGDLDLLVVNVNQHTSGDPIQNVLLYRNDTSNDNNWLKVRLEGVVSNRDGFGATIRIVVGSQAWVHDYNGGFGSHNSQHGTTAHFGLKEAEIVDSLIVFWPSGILDQFTNISANQMVSIQENGTLTGAEEILEEEIELQAFPNPFSEELHIQFRLSKREKVEIDMFDLLGRKVETVSKDWFPAGTHVVDWKPSESVKLTSWFALRFKSDNQIITQNVLYVN